MLDQKLQKVIEDWMWTHHPAGVAIVSEYKESYYRENLPPRDSDACVWWHNAEPRTYRQNVKVYTLIAGAHRCYYVPWFGGPGVADYYPSHFGRGVADDLKERDPATWLTEVQANLWAQIADHLSAEQQNLLIASVAERVAAWSAELAEYNAAFDDYTAAFLENVKVWNEAELFGQWRYDRENPHGYSWSLRHHIPDDLHISKRPIGDSPLDAATLRAEADKRRQNTAAIAALLSAAKSWKDYRAEDEPVAVADPVAEAPQAEKQTTIADLAQRFNRKRR